MGRTRIELDPMDKKSVADAIEQLKLYKELVIYENKLLVEKVAKQGVKNAKREIGMLGAVDSGNLQDSIKAEKITETDTFQVWEVNTNVDYAGFVEYGTGIVGVWSPHPNPKAVHGGGKVYSSYDSQQHGYNGWTYYKNGKKYWTLGYFSRPFFWNTARQLVHDTLRIAKRNYK